MIYIEEATIDSTSYNLFVSWILSEWGEVDPFPKLEERGLLPLPLLAFKDSEVVGGLQFSYYTDKEKKVKAIWVNTLYVAPAYRGQGIATLLIARAVAQMKQTKQSELFVYTNVPELYQKLGWETIKETDSNFVLKVSLVD